MAVKEYLIKYFSVRKRYFLYGNLLFWFIVQTENTLLYAESRSSVMAFIGLLTITAEGFLLTYLLRFLYKRFNWHRIRLLFLIPLIAVCAVVTSLVWSSLSIYIGQKFFDYPDDIPMEYLTQMFALNYSMIILWSCLYFGYKIWEEWKNERIQLERERELLRTSQLEMLKYQLNPHFLFNTLSSLRGLITVEPLKAKKMVTEISEFLRYSLLEGKNNEVQLIKEVEIIKQYLNIEQIRYDEDLLCEFDIMPEIYDIMIPIFLIHPLVENGVKHGMQSSKLPLRIMIKAFVDEDVLNIEVTNTGRWIERREDDMNNTGIGIANIKKRLEHSYPGKYSFEIIKGDDSVKAVIKIKQNKL